MIDIFDLVIATPTANIVQSKVGMRTAVVFFLSVLQSIHRIASYKKFVAPQLIFKHSFLIDAEVFSDICTWDKYKTRASVQAEFIN